MSVSDRTSEPNSAKESVNAIGEKIPTHAVIFDVSTDRGIRSGNQMLTEIMYSLFLKSLDYAKDIDLAETDVTVRERDTATRVKHAYASLALTRTAIDIHLASADI